MLQRQHSVASDFARLQDLQPYTLKLVIPVKQLVAQRRTGGEVANPAFNSSTAGGPAPEFAADHSERGNITNINSADLEREISLAEHSTTASLVEGTPEMSSYQSRYRDWFEQTSQAMVFLRVTLLRPGHNSRISSICSSVGPDTAFITASSTIEINEINTGGTGNRQKISEIS